MSHGFIGEINTIRANIEQVQTAIPAMTCDLDRDRAKRTIAHLKARIDEIDLGIKAPAFDAKVSRP